MASQQGQRGNNIVPGYYVVRALPGQRLFDDVPPKLVKTLDEDPSNLKAIGPYMEGTVVGEKVQEQSLNDLGFRITPEMFRTMQLKDPSIRMFRGKLFRLRRVEPNWTGNREFKIKPEILAELKKNMTNRNYDEDEYREAVLFRTGSHSQKNNSIFNRSSTPRDPIQWGSHRTPLGSQRFATPGSSAPSFAPFPNFVQDVLRRMGEGGQ